MSVFGGLENIDKFYYALFPVEDNIFEWSKYYQ